MSGLLRTTMDNFLKEKNMIEKRIFIRFTCDKCGEKYDVKGEDMILAKECAKILYGWRFVESKQGWFKTKVTCYCPKCAKTAEIQAGNL
jgi:ribosomal protein L44E